MKRLFLLFILAASGNIINTQYRWDKLYNFCPDTTLLASIPYNALADTNLILAAGNTTETGGLQSLGFIAAFNYPGNLLWKKYLRPDGRLNGASGYLNLARYDKNRYVYCGKLRNDIVDPGNPTMQPFFYFFNELGDSIRCAYYADSTRQATIASIAIDSQKNIIAAGSKTSYLKDSSAIWLIKLDTSGNKIWEHTYMMRENGNGFVVQSVAVSQDKTHYLISGVGRNLNPLEFDNFFMKVDSSGAISWFKWLYKPYYPPLCTEIQTIGSRNGGYLFVTSTPTKPLPNPWNGNYPWDDHIYYGKLNENGDTLWTRKVKHFHDTLALDTYGWSVTERQSGALLFLTHPGGSYPSVFQTDTTGNVMWTREYIRIVSFNVIHRCYNINETPTEGILLTGDLFSQAPDPGVYDSVGNLGRIILTDKWGCLVPNCQLGIEETNRPKHKLTLYPNPANDRISIQSESISLKAKINIYDVMGRKVMKEVTIQLNGAPSSLDISGLNRGIYIVCISDQTGGLIERITFLKE